MLFKFILWRETIPGCFEFVNFVESMNVKHRDYEVITPLGVNPSK